MCAHDVHTRVRVHAWEKEKKTLHVIKGIGAVITFKLFLSKPVHSII